MAKEQDALCQEGIDERLVSNDAVLHRRRRERRNGAERERFRVGPGLGCGGERREFGDGVRLQVKLEAEDGFPVEHAQIGEERAHETAKEVLVSIV